MAYKTAHVIYYPHALKGYVAGVHGAKVMDVVPVKDVTVDVDVVVVVYR